MARRRLLWVLGVAFAAGCQQQASLVGTLPPPTLNGPTIAQRAPTAPPVPSLPKIPTPALVAAPADGVPREWIPYAEPRPWQWIVIHHSATASGGAAAFDRMHREKGWDELGYHFVIGNGTDTGNGQIEVGSRWPKQKHGAHAKTPDNRYNDFGIGICLVGNFDLTQPTSAQMKSCARLVAFLMKTYHIPADHVLGHSDTKPTDCPGHYMSVVTIRHMADRILADSNEKRTPDTLAASGELLKDAHSR